MKMDDVERFLDELCATAEMSHDARVQLILALENRTLEAAAEVADESCGGNTASHIRDLKSNPEPEEPDVAPKLDDATELYDHACCELCILRANNGVSLTRVCEWINDIQDQALEVAAQSLNSIEITDRLSPAGAIRALKNKQEPTVDEGRKQAIAGVTGLLKRHWYTANECGNSDYAEELEAALDAYNARLGAGGQGMLDHSESQCRHAAEMFDGLAVQLRSYAERTRARELGG